LKVNRKLMNLCR